MFKSLKVPVPFVDQVNTFSLVADTSVDWNSYDKTALSS